MEGNRADKAHTAGIANWQREKDHAGLLGVRVDIVPTDNLSLGLERVSMFKSLNKHWILGDNAESDDQWNDIGGIDLRYRFPGVQLYGSLYGEDQAGGFPSEHARSVGVYFPQLFGGDGCWDMRLELSDTNNWWYGHWYLVNGWTYKDDILGDAMGKIPGNIMAVSAIIWLTATGSVWNIPVWIWTVLLPVIRVYMKCS